MHQTPSLVVLTLFLTKAAHCTKCDSFDNVTVTVRTDKERLYATTIQGCIERVRFEDVITQVYIKNQNIPRLGRDSVRNMKHLHSVMFYRCQLNVLEEGAFRNVPNLRSIQIVQNNVRTIPKGVFSAVPNLEILKLNSNRIDTIEDGSFANIPTLKKVYLYSNELTVWDKIWFTNSTNFVLLDFSFNKVKHLPGKAFYAFQKLREISFDYNELEVIHPEAFKGIKKLDYLGLRYNRLKVIDQNVFPNEIFIKSLVIDANYLNFLSKDLMVKLQVKELVLDGNPWKCSCLDQIMFWLYQINATSTTSSFCLGKEIPVCSFPSSYSKICVETIDEEVTMRFIDGLKKSPSLDKYCARLD